MKGVFRDLELGFGNIKTKEEATFYNVMNGESSKGTFEFTSSKIVPHVHIERWWR